MNPFKEKGYYLFKDFFSAEQVEEMYEVYNKAFKEDKLVYEKDVHFGNKVYAARRSNLNDGLSKFYDFATEKLQNHLGTKLAKTYHMGRIYTGYGGTMKMHIDRAPCEISITFTIAHNQNNWPITVGTGDNSIAIETPPGSALLYAGDKLYHRRDENTFNTIQYQHYMHWVDTSSECGSLISLFPESERGSDTLFSLNWKQLKSNYGVPVIDV